MLGFMQFWWLANKEETRQSTWSKCILSRAVEFEKAPKMNKDNSAEIKKWIMLTSWETPQKETSDELKRKKQWVWFKEGV